MVTSTFLAFEIVLVSDKFKKEKFTIGEVHTSVLQVMIHVHDAVIAT